MTATPTLHGSLRHFDFSEITVGDQLHAGHSACPGCGEAQAIKHILNALGPKTMMVVLPSCASIISGSAGQNSFQIPNLHMVFGGGAAAAAGLARALRLRGEEDTRVCVLGGDGGTYDIGLQGISGAAERQEDVFYICLDNEGYMNTGAQKSSASPIHAKTASTPGGKPTPKKDMTQIMIDHGAAYVATATVAFPDDLQKKVRKAREMRGFRFLTVMTPCLPGWGMKDDMSVRASRLAVETNYFPLFEVEGGTRCTISHRPLCLPLERFLELQVRFRGLSREQVADLQAGVDRRWSRIQRMAATSKW